MRTKLLVVVVVGVAALMFAAALWLSSDAPSAPSAPRLVESFSVLACSPKTTVGIEGCEEHRILALDRTINRLRVTIDASSPISSGVFNASEHAWYLARQRHCRAVAAVYEGGTIQPVVFGACLVKADLRHVALLRKTLDDASG